MKKKKGKVIGELKDKGRPQKLVPLEKEKYFRSSYKFFRGWMDIHENSDEKDINPMERIGIYCIVFSMMEDRLETFWWNCCYVHKWGVIIPESERVNRFILKKQGMRLPPIQKVPLTKKQWENREIPSDRTRTTGNFRKELVKNHKITENLGQRIELMEGDRKEIIHRNMFYMKHISINHINEGMEIFRELDKLLQKHKRGHKDLIGK